MGERNPVPGGATEEGRTGFRQGKAGVRSAREEAPSRAEGRNSLCGTLSGQKGIVLRYGWPVGPGRYPPGSSMGLKFVSERAGYCPHFFAVRFCESAFGLDAFLTFVG